MASTTARPLPDVSDGERIFGEAPGIRLGDQLYRLRFGFEALAYLEERFGSMEQFLAQLGQRAFGPGMIRAIRLAVTAGVLDDKPEEMEIEAFEKFVRRGLDRNGESASHMIMKLAQAINLQWPEPSPRTSAPKGLGSPAGSPGPRSTTSPRSPSAARKKSSRG